MLAKDFKKLYGSQKPTIRLNEELKINFIDSEIVFKEKSYSFGSVGEAAQELIVLDGLENWIKKNLN